MLCKNTSVYDFFFKGVLYKLYIVNRNCIFYGIFIEGYICYNLNRKRNAVDLALSSNYREGETYMKNSGALTRIISILLVVLMLWSGFLVSCHKEGTAGTVTSEEKGSTSIDTDGISDDRIDIPDGLPSSYDTDGFEIKFLTREGMEEEITLNDENSTDVIAEAVYNRQLNIEERFKCKITKIVEPQNPSGFMEKIRTSVSGDDNEFHIAIGHIDYVAALAPEGYLSIWQNVPYVNLDKPWWNKSANNSLTVGGNSFFALGDINYTLITQTNCIYFNKKLVEDYQIDDPYQTVLDGEWTLDCLSNLTKQYYSDINNNSERDIDDFYAYTVDVHSGLNSYQNASECLMFKKNNEDIPEFYANTKRMSNLVEKMYTILYENESTFAAYDYSYQGEEETYYWWDVGNRKFINGTTIFVHGWLGNATNVYRDFEGEYGIIPLPKYDEKQSTYHTMMDAAGSFMCIPRTIRDSEVENVGLIIEGMAAYGYKYITPAVFDTALKIKYSSLEGSGQMLDILIEGLTFDFGYVHSSDYHNILRKVLVQKSGNLSSYLASSQKSLINYYQRIIDAYLDYGLE